MLDSLPCMNFAQVNRQGYGMAQQSLTFQGVKTVEQVNKITTALMMLEGVDSAEVGRHGADVDGKAKRETLINAIDKLKLGVKVS